MGRGLVPQGGGAKVSSSTEPPPPLNVHVLDLIDEIGAVLAEVGGYRVADLINRPAEEVDRWKGGRLRRVTRDGVDIALDASAAWKGAEAVIGFERVWERRFGKCTECDLPTLGNFSGSATVQCSSCGHAISRTEYENNLITK
ncbi:hypothetical protein JRC04_05365 [Mycolicibacterium sp. S2-37]|uniref:hypothetical protein n=1 Tax=Mycolicibacterium sp. S2-37 TaxID=2810297 RepID=UPI001A93F11C|nr:hypothetical protein [Mycolicibacterium sp. S2-37]MBO0676884.1 hypothetical protein [Mycolicibacterium sp. S2-37]